MALLLTLCVTLMYSAYTIESARILGIFPAPTYSHHILGDRLMKELAARGHDVTVISPFLHKPPLKNYRDIQLDGFVEAYEEQKDKINFFEMFSSNALLADLMLNIMLLNGTEEVLIRDNVQKLLKSNEKFDVVIVEDFVSHALKGFCYHFNAPCVMLGTVGLTRLISSQVGNPLTPSYIPDFFLQYGSNMNLLERVHNSLTYLVTEKYFPGAPDMSDLYYNVSLALVNSHVSTQQPVPLVPNLIDVGGFHVQPPKPLPKDLQEYLDNAKEGVIYFSMGSNLRSASIPAEKREAILKAFAKLKQKVLWKWEDENLPGKPANVKIAKWLPQADILAHPNVKLFLTHGGLLSTLEAVYHGVPIVGIPIYGDQRMNLANAVNNGFALDIPYAELTEEKLFSTLNEVLTNPKYRDNAKLRSKIFHDQPIKPMDKAIFWVEYVIRHRGAPHLRTAALNLTWYQYLLLDVVLFLCVATITVLIALRCVCRTFLCKKHSKKVSEKKKKN